MKHSILVLTLLLAMPAAAEVLVIDKVEQESADVARPPNGMSMDTVRSRFGDPESIVDSVGDPPITRWEYPNFTVFFEYDRVIHAVMHRTAQPQ